ncbi:hypothetical protein GCM10018966_064450 [Streptomyces yanii]
MADGVPQVFLGQSAGALQRLAGVAQQDRPGPYPSACRARFGEDCLGSLGRFRQLSGVACALRRGQQPVCPVRLPRAARAACSKRRARPIRKQLCTDSGADTSVRAVSSSSCG